MKNTAVQSLEIQSISGKISKNVSAPEIFRVTKMKKISRKALEEMTKLRTIYIY